MKIAEKKCSFEELIFEGFRRAYLTAEEGQFCMRIGFVPEDLCRKIEKRIKLNPDADKPGIYKPPSTQEYIKQYLVIKFLIDPYSSN